MNNVDAYPGVRAILKNRDKFQGVRGSAGELITTDNKYMVALDTAPRAQAQNIMKDESGAKSAIRYLEGKEKRFCDVLCADGRHPAEVAFCRYQIPAREDIHRCKSDVRHRAMRCRYQ